MIAEISCHIEFAEAGAAEALLMYLRDKGGRARRLANVVEVTQTRDEAGKVVEGHVTLDYSVDTTPAVRDLVIARLKLYRTTLAAQIKSGSSGFIETRDCYHDEGLPCDKVSQQRLEWGVQE